MRRIASTVLLAGALAALAGCGEGDGSEPEPPANPGALLERALAAVDSARVDSTVHLDLVGGSPPAGPIGVQLEGPYVTEGRGFPKFDWQGTVEALGFEVDLELVSLGDNVLVSVYGEGYEVGVDEFAALSRRLSGLRPAPGELTGPVRYEGGEEVDGTKTYHLAAAVDAGSAAEGLGPVQDALGLSSPPAPHGGVDVWVGVGDELPRAITIDLAWRVPPEDRAALRGTRRVEAELAVELAEVNEPQELPERSRGIYQPIPELLESLEGLARLAG